MGCLPASYRVAIEKLFSRIRCISACCGDSIVVQNSEFCDGETVGRDILRPKSTRKFRWGRKYYRAAVERGRKIRVERYKNGCENKIFTPYTNHPGADKQKTESLSGE